VDLGRPPRVVAEDLRGERDLDLAGVEERLAGVEALEPGHLVQVLHDEVAELPHDPPALGGAHARPRARVERLAGRRDGEVDVALVALSHLRARLLVRGIDRGVGRPGDGRTPVAGDEELIGVHG